MNKSKKAVTLFAVLLLSVLLIACKKNNESGDGEQASQTVQTEKKATPIHLTEAQFLKKVMNYKENPDEWNYLGDKPAIIDFYADWCGPCKRIAPILEELATEYAGKIYVYKIDTDAEQGLAAIFGIRSIPTLLLVPMNDAPQMIQGAISKASFQEAIQSVLLKE
jgi:thioredoxin